MAKAKSAISQKNDLYGADDLTFTRFDDVGSQDSSKEEKAVTRTAKGRDSSSKKKMTEEPITDDEFFIEREDEREQRYELSAAKSGTVTSRALKNRRKTKSGRCTQRMSAILTDKAYDYLSYVEYHTGKSKNNILISTLESLWDEIEWKKHD